MTMENGTIVEWYIDDGAHVTAGQAVYKLETEKLETDVEAEADGLLHQVAAAGSTLLPGAVVGWLLADGEAPPDSGAPPAAAPAVPVGGATSSDGNGKGAVGPAAAVSTPGGRVAATPNARRLAADHGIDLATIAGTGPGGRITGDDVTTAITAGPTAPSGRVAATPNARRLAADHGIDLATIAGTGPGGRITGDDVTTAITAGPTSTGDDAEAEAAVDAAPPPSPVIRRLAEQRGVI